jgi:hypothetical protein
VSRAFLRGLLHPWRPDPEQARRVAGLEKEVALLRKRAGASGLHPRPYDDRAFLDVAGLVKGKGRTMLGRDRLWIFWQAVGNVAALDGAAAEIGTYRGGTAYFIASSFVERTGSEVPMEVIDTFEGHPAERLTDHDGDTHRDPALFKDTSYENVKEYLSPFERLTVHKGEFKSVKPTLPDQQYRLVHVDTDLYEPTSDCLDYFGDRLVHGGVIVVDDYVASDARGVRPAVDEYLAAHAGFQAWNPNTKQIVLVRTGG